MKPGVAMLSVQYRTGIRAFCPSAFSASITLCVYLVHTIRQQVHERMDISHVTTVPPMVLTFSVG